MQPSLLADERGFGLLEVLVTLFISLYVLASALIGQSQLTSSFNRAISLKQLEGDLRRGRSEAVAAGARAVVTVSADGTGYTLGLDYAPYSDPAASDEVLLQSNLPLGVTLVTTQPITFDPRGYSIEADGSAQTVVANLAQRGDQFATGTLFAAGYFEF